MANFGRTQPGAGSVTIAAAETEPVAHAPVSQVATETPEPVAQGVQTSITLAEPATAVIWPSLLVDASVLAVKTREEVRHPRSGDLPAAAGKQDEALVAWLESLPRGERSESGAVDLDDAPSEFDRAGFQADEDTDGSLELAFALFDSAGF